MSRELEPTHYPDPIQASFNNFVDTLDPELKKKLALQGTTGITMVSYLLALSFLSQGDLIPGFSFLGVALFTGAIATNTVRDEFRHKPLSPDHDSMQ